MGMKAGKRKKARGKKPRTNRQETALELARARAAVDLLPPDEANPFLQLFDAIDDLREAAASGEVAPQALFDRLGALGEEEE